MASIGDHWKSISNSKLQEGVRFPNLGRIFIIFIKLIFQIITHSMEFQNVSASRLSCSTGLWYVDSKLLLISSNLDG